VRIANMASWDWLIIRGRGAGGHGECEGVDLVLVRYRVRRILKDEGEGTCFQLSQRFIAACSYPTNNYKDIMKAQVHVSRLPLL
nr:hypothetical protein [Tanacetum cinerariifolium]